MCVSVCRQRGLFRVLKAYTQYQPEEGYCQAQGPVAAVLLMNMPAEVAITDTLLFSFKHWSFADSCFIFLLHYQLFWLHVTWHKNCYRVITSLTIKGITKKILYTHNHPTLNEPLWRLMLAYCLSMCRWQEAFWCLVQISEQYLPGYYSPLLVRTFKMHLTLILLFIYLLKMYYFVIINRVIQR